MSVVIEELEVEAAPQPAAPPAAAAESSPGGEVDERALHAMLAREAWRQDRLAAD